MHQVSVSRAQRLVSVTISGFVTTTAVDAAARDLHVAIRRLGGTPGTHLTLYDLSGVEVAPLDTIELFRGFFVDPCYESIWARKVAFVASGSALFGLQLKRVQRDRPGIRTFADRPAAIAWLLAA